MNALIYLDTARAEVLKQVNQPKIYSKLRSLIVSDSGTVNLLSVVLSRDQCVIISAQRI